jgi:membrane-associated protein
VTGNFALNPLDATGLLTTFGVIGVLAIIFAETGLMVGFFFPGDSLLFLAGIAASPFASHVLKGVSPLNLAALLIGAPICAIAGAQLGHFLGAKYGRRLFDKPQSRLFKPAYVEKAEHYFEKFGPARAVILARFVPVVRTFLNPVAGVLEMPAGRFFLYNVVGGLLWTDGVLLAGYWLAKRLTNVPNVDNYILPFTFLIVIVSGIPIYIEVIRGLRERRRQRDGGAPKEARHRAVADRQG